nr:uncharacterized protein LOC127310537 [Lolium perenne]
MSFPIRGMPCAKQRQDGEGCWLYCVTQENCLTRLLYSMDLFAALIVVGTPGRILALATDKDISCKNVRWSRMHKRLWSIAGVKTCCGKWKKINFGVSRFVVVQSHRPRKSNCQANHMEMHLAGASQEACLDLLEGSGGGMGGAMPRCMGCGMPDIILNDRDLMTTFGDPEDMVALQDGLLEA